MKNIFDKLKYILRAGGLFSLGAFLLFCGAVLLFCVMAVLSLSLLQPVKTLTHEIVLEFAGISGMFAVMLSVFAFCVGLIALLFVAISRKLTSYNPALYIIFLSIALTIIAMMFNVGLIDKLRHINGHASHGRHTLEYLYSAFEDYHESHSDLLPDCDSWCDSLIESDNFISEPFQFQLGYYEDDQIDCTFNINLSGLKFKDIPANTILLFEAHGPWNNSGTQKLLSATDTRYGYIFILFADGTIGRYWENGKLTLFDDKPEDDYLPLKWKP